MKDVGLGSKYTSVFLFVYGQTENKNKLFSQRKMNISLRTLHSEEKKAKIKII